MLKAFMILSCVVVCFASVPSSWSPKQVATFVKDLGAPLAQYAQLFVDEEVSGKELMLIDKDWLRELGVSVIGHRILLLDHIKALPPSKQSGYDTPSSLTQKSRVQQVRRWSTALDIEQAMQKMRADPTALRDVLRAQLSLCGASSRIKDKFGRSRAVSSATNMELAAALRLLLAAASLKSTHETATQGQVESKDRKETAPPRSVPYTVRQLIPRPGEEWFGLAVSIDNTTTDIIMREGENTTEAAVRFLTAHGAHDSHTMSHLAESLESVGGGACDACKTFVEEVTASFVAMAFSGKEGRIQEGAKSAKKNMGVTVGWQVSMEAETFEKLQAICESPQMSNYAPHIKQWCHWYVSNNVTQEIFIKAGEANGDKEIFDRKQRICVDLVKHCAARSPVMPKMLTPCRACAEAMADIGFHLRRDRRDIELQSTKQHYASPLQREVLSQRAQRDRYLGFKSRSHVHSRLLAICETLPMRHSPDVAEDIQEMCEDVTSEHESAVVDAFADPAGKDSDAVQEICVSVASQCEQAELDAFRKNLMSYALDQPGGVQQPQSRMNRE